MQNYIMYYISDYGRLGAAGNNAGFKCAARITRALLERLALLIVRPMRLHCARAARLRYVLSGGRRLNDFTTFSYIYYAQSYMCMY